MGIFDLLPEWVSADAAIKKVVKVLEEVQQKGLAVGVVRPTGHPFVFVEEVVMSGLPASDIEEGEIKKSHGETDGAWGTTKVNARLQFALPQGKDSSFSIVLMKVQVGATITLKAASEFNELKDFAPLYKRLMTDFGGRKDEFCVAMGMRMFKDYNAFGTVDGVLYHELLHYTLAKTFARKLHRKTVGALSGQSFDSREEATAAFLDVVNDVWKDWRGLMLHDVAFFDERFVWEKECAYYVKEYESAGKPGYSE